MGRSAWKGPYVAVSLLKDVIAVARQHPEWWNKTRFQGAPAPAVIKTQSRASVILPDFLRCVFFVHNGNKRMVRLEVSENMVGHKFGEFAPTRKVGWMWQWFVWGGGGTTVMTAGHVQFVSPKHKCFTLDRRHKSSMRASLPTHMLQWLPCSSLTLCVLLCCVYCCIYCCVCCCVCCCAAAAAQTQGQEVNSTA
jgi:small subunit ribosomal protein S19